MVYTLCFSSSKCSLFHNSNVFGSCIIHILYTECAKIKKNNSVSKRLVAHNCTHSFRYCQPVVLLADIVAEIEVQLTIPDSVSTIMCY